MHGVLVAAVVLICVACRPEPAAPPARELARPRPCGPWSSFDRELIPAESMEAFGRWVAARKQRQPTARLCVEQATVDGDGWIVVAQRSEARACREHWYRLRVDAEGQTWAVTEDGLGATCCAGSRCAIDDPAAWLLRYQRARLRKDPVELASLIDPVHGVRADVEGLVSMKYAGVRTRREARELLDAIELTDLFELDIRCDRTFAPDGTATCIVSPDRFPSTYHWQRDARGVFLRALREGDGVE